MFTRPNLLGQGFTTELGGEFIDSNHEEMLALMQEFGFDKDKVDVRSKEAASLKPESYFINGRHYTQAQAAHAFMPLAKRIFEDYDAMEDVVDYKHEGGGGAIDKMTLTQYFNKIGATGWMRELLEVAYVTEYGLDADDQSALNFVGLIGTGDLEKSKELGWRAPVSSINLLITSLVWRQDHNGFTHQDPGFLDVVTNKSPDVVRIYLPPDANCLLSVADHCLRSKDYYNVIVADKQPHLTFLEMEAAVKHCTKGIGIWDWASTDAGTEPEAVMACAGDIATMEALAATALLREKCPDVKIRFVNVVDLFRLMPDTEHPHGMSDRDFDSLFTRDKPVIFNFHSYASLVHKLAYRRTNHVNFHVRGYKEKGNINTPLELAIINQIDRFNLAIDVIDRVPRLQRTAAHVKDWLQEQIVDHLNYARAQGTDREEIRNWTWPADHGRPS